MPFRSILVPSLSQEYSEERAAARATTRTAWHQEEPELVIVRTAFPAVFDQQGGTYAINLSVAHGKCPPYLKKDFFDLFLAAGRKSSAHPTPPPRRITGQKSECCTSVQSG